MMGGMIMSLIIIGLFVDRQASSPGAVQIVWGRAFGGRHERVWRWGWRLRQRDVQGVH